MNKTAENQYDHSEQKMTAIEAFFETVFEPGKLSNVFLINGLKLDGKILEMDSKGLLLDGGHRGRMFVFLNSIATIKNVE